MIHKWGGAVSLTHFAGIGWLDDYASLSLQETYWRNILTRIAFNSYWTAEKHKEAVDTV